VNQTARIKKTSARTPRTKSPSPTTISTPKYPFSFYY